MQRSRENAQTEGAAGAKYCSGNVLGMCEYQKECHRPLRLDHPGLAGQRMAFGFHLKHSRKKLEVFSREVTGSKSYFKEIPLTIK